MLQRAARADAKRAKAAQTPRLAIVITCFNYESFVEQAIRSVLDQGRDDCELVVVDDGSRDSSWDVISRTGVQAYQLTNSGQRAACLFGLDKTTAPFVLFLDADDVLKRGAIETILKLLDGDVAKLQFGLTLMDADGIETATGHWSLENYRLREPLAREVLQRGVYKTPPTSGNVFRRDVCELLREAVYDSAVDGIILFVAPFLGDVISISDELGRYRIHGQNKSGMGRAPKATSFAREIDRFVARMDHQRVVLARRGFDQLVDPRDTYYFRERNFYYGIALGQRPKWKATLQLLQTLWREQHALKSRLVLSAIFILLAALPDSRRKAVLTYRLKPGSRSPSGLFKALLRP